MPKLFAYFLLVLALTGCQTLSQSDACPPETVDTSGYSVVASASHAVDDKEDECTEGEIRCSVCRATPGHDAWHSKSQCKNGQWKTLERCSQRTSC